MIRGAFAANTEAGSRLTTMTNDKSRDRSFFFICHNPFFYFRKNAPEFCRKSDGPFRPLTGRTGWLMHPDRVSLTPPDCSKKLRWFKDEPPQPFFCAN